jgi:hypothetical protein
VKPYTPEECYPEQFALSPPTWERTRATAEALARAREALRKAIDLTCNCARDPEFRALGHAEWCDARAVLAEEPK